MTKIGDTLYHHRNIRRSDEEWVEVKIDGETPVSWVLNKGAWNEHKVNKKTLCQSAADAGQRGFGGVQWYTAQGKADAEWMEKHRRRITSLVEASRDVATLKKVAELVGYKP